MIPGVQPLADDEKDRWTQQDAACVRSRSVFPEGLLTP